MLNIKKPYFDVFLPIIYPLFSSIICFFYLLENLFFHHFPGLLLSLFQVPLNKSSQRKMINNYETDKIEQLCHVDTILLVSVMTSSNSYQ